MCGVWTRTVANSQKREDVQCSTAPLEAGSASGAPQRAFFFLLRTLKDPWGLDSQKPSLLRMERGESGVCLLAFSDAPGAREADREWAAEGQGLSYSESGGGE